MGWHRNEVCCQLGLHEEAKPYRRRIVNSLQDCLHAILQWPGCNMLAKTFSSNPACLSKDVECLSCNRQFDMIFNDRLMRWPCRSIWATFWNLSNVQQWCRDNLLFARVYGMLFPLLICRTLHIMAYGVSRPSVVCDIVAPYAET